MSCCEFCSYNSFIDLLPFTRPFFYSFWDQYTHTLLVKFLVRVKYACNICSVVIFPSYFADSHHLKLQFCHVFSSWFNLDDLLRVRVLHITNLNLLRSPGRLLVIGIILYQSSYVSFWIVPTIQKMLRPVPYVKKNCGATFRNVNDPICWDRRLHSTLMWYMQNTYR